MASRPPGHRQIIPYLYYEDAWPALEFMQKAFGFEIESVFRSPSDGA